MLTSHTRAAAAPFTVLVNSHSQQDGQQGLVFLHSGEVLPQFKLGRGHRQQPVGDEGGSVTHKASHVADVEAGDGLSISTIEVAKAQGTWHISRQRNKPVSTTKLALARYFA